MKRYCVFFILIIILMLKFNTPALARLAIIETDDFSNHQWGALEDLLNDWNKNTISTDECVLYGCYILSAQDSSKANTSQIKKLIPHKYTLFKKSQNKEPYFFINEIYKIEHLLDQKSLNEFHNSDWSDYEFIQEITNNNELIKLILNSPILRDDDGNEYRDFCYVIKSAYAQNILKPETIYYIGILPRINPQRYIQIITPFWNRYKLKCKSSCPDSLEDIISQVKFSVFVNNKKLIKVINFFWFSLKNFKSVIIKDENFEITNLGVDGPTVQKYKNFLNQYCSKMISFGLKKPLDISKKILVNLHNTYCPDPNYLNAYSLTTPITKPSNEKIVISTFIEFFIPKITDDIKIAPPEKHVIHELMHSITYSYDSKETTLNDYHWYLQNSHNNSKDCMRNFEESSAS